MSLRAMVAAVVVHLLIVSGVGTACEDAYVSCPARGATSL